MNSCLYVRSLRVHTYVRIHADCIGNSFSWLNDNECFQVSFLKNAPESFLKEITLITQKVVLVPDQIILHKGQEQNSMCFISHGVLEVRIYVYSDAFA